MAVHRTTLVMPLLLAGLAGPGIGGCALDTDSEPPEQSAPISATPAPDPELDPDTPPDDGGTCDDGCTSTMNEYGLVCTTCPDDGDAPPECLVGSCSVIDRCLHCTDPRGHVGVDCSIDYESLPTASSGIGGGDNFHVCSTSWGFPGGSSGHCHYPGTESCTIDEAAGCIDCTYPDGSGSGLCQDPAEPLPDVMAGRPSTLPPPGECVNELGPDGAIVCSTCTREDLGASKMCRFAPAESCDVSGGGNPAEKCMACALEGGGVAEICDGAGT